MAQVAVQLLLQLAAACPAAGVPAERIASRVESHARVESGLESLALRDNTTHRRYTPASETAAIALVKSLLAQGHSLDAGLMQVNSQNWARLNLSAETVFDQAHNVCAGLAILGEAYQIERRVSCRYNTGKPDCTNGYPDLIRAAWRGPVIGPLDPIPASPPPPPVMINVLRGGGPPVLVALDGPVNTVIHNKRR